MMLVEMMMKSILMMVMFTYTPHYTTELAQIIQVVVIISIMKMKMKDSVHLQDNMRMYSRII